MPLKKLIKLRKIHLDSVFEYSKFLLPIYTSQQFSTEPPLEYENPYEETLRDEISINPLTTKHYFIPQVNKEIFLMGVMHNNQESAIEVSEFMDQYAPDTTVLEIDDNRYQLMMGNYEKYKPEKVMDVLKKNEGSFRLIFKKRLEYIVAKEKAKKIEYKKSDIILGDMDYHEFMNNVQFARSQCKCNGSFKDVGSQLARLMYFSGKLFSTYFKQLFFKRVPYTKSMVWHLQNLAVVKDNCIVNQVHYHRDFFMFRNIITKTYGNRVFVIVGIFHLKNLTKLLTLYQEACQKLYTGAEQESFDRLNLPSIDETITKAQEREERLYKIFDYVDFNKNKVYCNETHTEQK